MTTENHPRPRRFVSMRIGIMGLFTLSFLLLMIVGYLAFQFIATPLITGIARTTMIDALQAGDNDLTEAQIDGLTDEIDMGVAAGLGIIGPRNAAAIFISLFIVGSVNNALIATIVTRELKLLASAARKIGEGVYDHDLSKIYERLPFDNEMTELARAIEDSGKTHQREEVLKQQVEKLEIHIDQAKRGDEFSDIAQSTWYQSLRQAADEMRTERGED